MATQSWYDYGINNPHGSDDGVDLPTPNDTPVWFPFDAKVIDANWYDYGGQVAAAIPGTDYSEYFIHLDKIYVKPGQTVPAGTVIGTTGGGVGDLIRHNGTVQPAQSQAWYGGHSSGYHTEYGLFEGQDMSSFNQGWGQPARQLDPTSIIQELQAGQRPSFPGPGKPQTALTASLSNVGGTVGGVLGAGVFATLFPWAASGNSVAIGYHVISWMIGLAGVASIGLGGLFVYAGLKHESPAVVIQDGLRTARGVQQKAQAVAVKAAAA